MEELLTCKSSPIITKERKLGMKRKNHNVNDVPMQIDNSFFLLFSINKKNEEISHNVIFPEKWNLMNYQKEGVSWLLSREFGFVADTVGSGKTRQMLAFILLKNEPTLIVMPSILQNQWRNELEFLKKNDDIKDENFQRAEIVITNFEKKNKELFERKWKHLVIDEVHNLKGKGAWFNKIQNIQREHTWCISATPLMNSYSDGEPIVLLLSNKNFKKNHYLEWNSYLKFHTLKRDFSKVLDLKPLFCHDIKIECHHKIDINRSDLSTTRQCINLCSIPKNLIHVLAGKKNKMSEISTSVDKEEQYEEDQINNNDDYMLKLERPCRYKKLKEIIEKHSNEKMLIFSSMVKTLMIFSWFLKLDMSTKNADEFQIFLIHGDQTTEQNNKILQSFKESKAKSSVLFLSLSMSASGLNITEASVGILIEFWWNEALEEQALGRIYRKGQTKECNFYRLSDSTHLDPEIEELKENKTKTIKLLRL